MKNNANSRKNAARIERLQQKTEAGLVAAHFPEVADIAVSMTYNQIGLNKSLLRKVNFFPGSYAFFRIDCINRDCTDGGFDLTKVITATIGRHGHSAKGDLICQGTGPAEGHSAITYQIDIHYS
jgi:hypothetical protein